MSRILFVLKQREKTAYNWEYSNNGDCDSYDGCESYDGNYSCPPYHSKPSGLLNSAVFVAESIADYLHYDVKVVEVFDNSSIWKEIRDYRPTHVIIEALWVVPSKFYELIPLYPNVKWIIRVHSKEVFLANEGIALQWIRAYQKLTEQYSNFHVSFNNEETNDNFRRLKIDALYLPNIYMPKHKKEEIREELRVQRDKSIINIGCFGAIRPMKNQLIQAMAAIEFAESIGKTLHFHVNGTRIEQRGDEALKNLRALFSESGHKLVEHEWYKHNDFCKIIEQMDLGMQVSLSESFNIVTADFVGKNVPIVVSQDIDWMPWFTRCDPTDSLQMVRRLKFNYFHGKIAKFFNSIALKKHNVHALVEWKHVIEGKKK